MKCKHCEHHAPDLPELKFHWASRHKAEWAKHLRNMRVLDIDQAPKLTKAD